MAEATSRLYVPAFGGIYSALNEFAEPILRIALGRQFSSRTGCKSCSECSAAWA